MGRGRRIECVCGHAKTTHRAGGKGTPPNFKLVYRGCKICDCKKFIRRK